MSLTAVQIDAIRCAYEAVEGLRRERRAHGQRQAAEGLRAARAALDSLCTGIMDRATQRKIERLYDALDIAAEGIAELSYGSTLESVAGRA